MKPHISKQQAKKLRRLVRAYADNFNTLGELECSCAYNSIPVGKQLRQEKKTERAYYRMEAYIDLLSGIDTIKVPNDA